MRTAHQRILAAASVQLSANGHGDVEGVSMDRKTGKLDGLQPMGKHETIINNNGLADSPVEKDCLTLAGEQAIAHVDALDAHPRNWFRQSINFCLSLNYPSPERRASAANAIAAAEIEACKALSAIPWNLTALVETIRNLRQQCYDFSIRPLPVVSFADNLAGHIVAMNKLGWLSVEVECLKTFADPSSQVRIYSYTASDVTLSDGRTIDRAAIRDRLMPVGPTVAEWQASGQYLSLKQAHENSIALEQQRQLDARVVISAGPARMIGKVAPA